MRPRRQFTNNIQGGIRLQCRWCRKFMPRQFLQAHEPMCLDTRQAEVAAKLTKAADRLHAKICGDRYLRRWRELPGRGWGALGASECPVVELVRGARAR